MPSAEPLKKTPAPVVTERTEATNTAGSRVNDLTVLTDFVDIETFEQILEMDDDEEREFSRGIVFGFFEQAEDAFEKLQENIEKEEFESISSLGHFLKGSSATLGLNDVRDACEKIQHYGQKKDADGITPIDEPTALRNSKETLVALEKDYKIVREKLKSFYPEEEEEEE